MAARISSAFAAARARGAPAFVAYLPAGFPRVADTVPALLAMQAEGVDVVELGVPFSDPMADGGTIQAANMVALANGVTLRGVLAMVKEARASGVTLRGLAARAPRVPRARARVRACRASNDLLRWRACLRVLRSLSWRVPRNGRPSAEHTSDVHRQSVDAGNPARHTMD
jgi:hypothetical protein